LSDEFLQRIGYLPEPGATSYLEVIDERFQKKIVKQKAIMPIRVGDRTLSIEEVLQMAREFPLPTGTISWLDEWLVRNEASLLALREASAKTHFYSPILGQPLLQASLSFPAALRAISQSLLTASMFRLGRGDLRQAMLDQLAVVQIGRTCQRSSAVIAVWNIGVAIEIEGLKSLQRSVLYGNLDSKELNWLRQRLDELPVRQPLSVAQINADRAVILDAQLFSGRLGVNEMSPMAYVHPESVNGAPLMMSDWNEVMREVNQSFEKLENIVLLEDRLARSRELEALYKSLKSDDLQSKISSFSFTAKQRGKTIGQIAWRNLCPDVLSLHNADIFSATHVHMLRLCIALQDFRIKQGKYPSNLEELTPEFLDTIPTDPATSQSYIYNSSSDARVLLYSFGPNGQDDKGKGREASDKSLESVDDIAVLRPVGSVEAWVKQNLSDHPHENMTLSEVIEMAKEISEEIIKEKSQ
jgi:hypothetical protein